MLDNDNLEEIDKEFVLNTYSRDYIHFTHGNGARIYTNKNEEFIDFTSGIGVNSLGHNHAKLISEIQDQAKKIIHSSNLFLIPSQAKLAQKISQIAGYYAKTFFCNSGLEANECAIKIARKYGESTNRFEIITLKNSFHGRSIATLSACGQDKMHKHFAPFLSGFIHAKNIKEAINIANERKSVIAIFLELIQGEGGIYEMPKNDIIELRQWSEENNILLMVDEVQSGVYRSGEFLTSQIYDIVPDVTTLAKGLAGGIPIGATITTKVDIFESGDHGSTFGGNFLSTKAALCVLEVLQNYKDSKELEKNINFFDKKLKEICNSHKDIFKQISGIGFMKGIKIKDDEILNKIIKNTKKHKLLLLKSGNSTLRFLPPLLISQDEINEGFQRFKEAVKEL